MRSCTLFWLIVLVSTPAFASDTGAGLLTICRRALSGQFPGWFKTHSDRELLAAVVAGRAIQAVPSVREVDLWYLDQALRRVRWSLKYTPKVVLQLLPVKSQIYVFDDTTFSLTRETDGSRQIRRIETHFARYALKEMHYDASQVNLAWLNYNMKPYFPFYRSIFPLLSNRWNRWSHLSATVLHGDLTVYSKDRNYIYRLNVDMAPDHSTLRMGRRRENRRLEPNTWVASGDYLKGLLAPADAEDPLHRLLANEGTEVTVQSGAATMDIFNRLQAAGIKFTD